MKKIELLKESLKKVEKVLRKCVFGYLNFQGAVGAILEHVGDLHNDPTDPSPSLFEQSYMSEDCSKFQGSLGRTKSVKKVVPPYQLISWVNDFFNYNYIIFKSLVSMQNVHYIQLQSGGIFEYLFCI